MVFGIGTDLVELSRIKKTYELVELKDAYERVLAKDIKATKDIPNYKNSAMDGYAVNFTDTSERIFTFKCIGESYAGHPFMGDVKPNYAIKVMTGALVPNKCNAVKSLLYFIFFISLFNFNNFSTK